MVHSLFTTNTALNFCAAERTVSTRFSRNLATLISKNAAISPKCGVKTGVCLHCCNNSPRPQKAKMPSASMIIGLSMLAAILRTSSNVSLSRPSPGPTSKTSWRSAICIMLPKARSPPITPWALSSTGYVITSVNFTSIKSCKLLPIAKVAMPAPTFNAACDVSAAAPVSPGLPATHSTRPHEPLCALNGRCGNLLPAMSSSIRVCFISSFFKSMAGIPIESTSKFPDSSAPGEIKCPIFGKPSDTVS